MSQWNVHSPFSVIKRFEGSVPVPEKNPDSKEEDARSREVLPSIPGSKTTDDVMIIVFTCKVCNTRSARKMSKEAYNHGVVLIRCPGCNNLHLIADHLGYFDDNSTNVEQILAQKGEKVTRMDDKQVLEFLHKEDLK
ncbi:Zim17 [Blastocystis hominis]|uniref:Zim17 n=1 Tax=Blastocystis hominis TaxID=12968 RepID=D8LWI0_BLAHO|nr:Zim17 [Blastocystis hominis]CBK20169.2 Zim17 [Blastocystis hominis]|eukprot:XP_012894217.1 Zim17 [Blastocystis hominis]